MRYTAQFVIAIGLLTPWLGGAASAEAIEAPESAEFSSLVDTEQIQSGLQPPAQATASIELPQGFHATLFASEPAVRQPIAVATDPRGRLWVAENYTYSEGSIGFHTTLHDRIIILEDSDGDGCADRRTVFWDEARKLTSVEVGLGGVWALCPPHLLFLPDANGDDRPDSEPIVVLDGWVDGARHNVANGLRWGPDGWLYGRHGILRTSRVGVPGGPDERRTSINCGIWRYHPTRKEFQVVAHGTTNPWGMDWDRFGQLFFVNTVIGHLWHAIPGAHYERMFGEDLIPHLYELIPQTADHVHWDAAEAWAEINKSGVSRTTDQAGGGHAHAGLMIYQGDNWPESYRGDAYMLNFHGRRVNRDKIERRGASYVGLHEADVVRFKDEWFRGIDLLSGPDGGVYIADWSDAGECHEEDGIHRNSGRIFKITYGERPATGAIDIASLGNFELLDLQRQENEWQVRQSRQELRARAVAGSELSGVKEALYDWFASATDPVHRLRSMWCLNAVEGCDSGWLLAQLYDRDEHVRVWAIILLEELGALANHDVQQALLQSAKNDESGLVLLTIASSLQRLPLALRWPLAERLAQRAEFCEDPVFPLMLWYGIEPATSVMPDRALGLIGTSKLSTLRRNLVRRLASDVESCPDPLVLLAEDFARSDDVVWRRDVLQGMSAAMQGMRQVAPPAGWPAALQATLDNLHDDEQSRQLARELLVVFGGGRATDELIHLVSSPKTPPEHRRNGIRSLVAARPAGLVQALQKLLSDPAVAAEAVRGLAAFDDPQTPALILAHYGQFDATVRDDAISTLSSRIEYVRELLKAIAANEFAKEEISVFHVRHMWDLGDEAIHEQLNGLWPELRPSSNEKSKQLATYRALLTPQRLANANRSQGRLQFDKSCAACHRLFGEGQGIGPDLTGAQRHDLGYLLHNLVEPNLQVAENYRITNVLLEEGRMISGIVTSRDGPVIKVQTQTELLQIPRDEIDDLIDSDLSMMPEQILAALKPNQVCDLVAYLMSPQQVPLPDESRDISAEEVQLETRQ